MVVARTEFWSVSALALTAIGCSIVPSLAAVAPAADAAEAGAAGGAGATWASAATLKQAEAGGERAQRQQSLRGRGTRLGSDERMKSVRPMHGAFLSVRHGLAAAGWCEDVDDEEAGYLVRISFPRAVCLSR